MATQGFTLIEILVVITIISVISALLLVGWPTVRNEQAFTLTGALLRSQLHTAEEQALNQQQADPSGLAIQGSQLVMFTDTNGNKQYDDGGDQVLERQSFPGGIVSTAAGWQSWVFESAPPNMNFFGPGGQPLVGDDASTLTVKRDTDMRVFTIKAYGQVYAGTP